MSSFTPRFSTQVSPSCSCSSNSKPYCMPEQPPPCTKTRSFKLGLPSPRMRSPTLRAAASVNLRVSVSVSLMACTLRAGFGCRNRRRCFGLRFRGLVFAQRYQFSRYDGARRHFNDPVVNIAIDARRASEDQAIARVHVPVYGAVHDDIGDFDIAFDEAALADREGASVGGVARNIAVHTAVEMQAAREFQVAIERGCFPEKCIDARG